jgi:hypothetical protein
LGFAGMAGGEGGDEEVAEGTNHWVGMTFNGGCRGVVTRFLGGSEREWTLPVEGLCQDGGWI